MPRSGHFLQMPSFRRFSLAGPASQSSPEYLCKNNMCAVSSSTRRYNYEIKVQVKSRRAFIATSCGGFAICAVSAFTAPTLQLHIVGGPGPTHPHRYPTCSTVGAPIPSRGNEGGMAHTGLLPRLGLILIDRNCLASGPSNKPIKRH